MSLLDTESIEEFVQTPYLALHIIVCGFQFCAFTNSGYRVQVSMTAVARQAVIQDAPWVPQRPAGMCQVGNGGTCGCSLADSTNFVELSWQNPFLLLAPCGSRLIL